VTTLQVQYYESLLHDEREHAARLHEEKKVAARERALETLHNAPERYGICVKCGRPIDSDRLRIIPATRYCEDDAERRPLAFTGPDTAW